MNAAASMDPSLWAVPSCEGSLLKKGHVRKNWKWRWFRLQDKNLFYFATRDPSEKPLGHIDLTHYMVKKTPSNTRQYGFGLYSTQLPSYPLCAIDEQDYLKWLTFLKLATKGAKINKDPDLLADGMARSRDVGIAKSYTEPSNNQGATPTGSPSVENRSRNRSTSSGDMRVADKSSPPQKKHMSMASPRSKPVVVLMRASEDKDQDDLPNPYNLEDSSDDIVENEDFSDGEGFDPVALAKERKRVESPFSTEDLKSSSPSSPMLSKSNPEASSPLSATPDAYFSPSTSPVVPHIDTNRLANSSPSINNYNNSNSQNNSTSFIRIAKSPRVQMLRDSEKKVPSKEDRAKDIKNSRVNRYSTNLFELTSSVERDGESNLESLKCGDKRLTTEDYPDQYEVRTPEMSPRTVELLRRADLDSAELNRRLSRSIGLMDSIMEEISEETVVLNPDQQNAKNTDDDDKPSSWRAIRRSILPSPDLISKLKGGNHRGISPSEFAIIAEEEEKEKLRKLKEIFIVKEDPLQKYNIVNRSIGKGAVGEVFFATNKETEMKVAIKKLQLERKGKDRLPFILREIEIIATSSHENIVSYIESYEMGGELWVVMEYMSSGSLYDLVKLHSRGCRLDESLTAYCIREVIKAVDFLHFRKRIHRDIKVDNILVKNDGAVKLADFGTAVQLTFQRLRRTTLAGTPYYMAPELIQRIPYNEKVDIWSIGITVVEIMNGRPPFYELDPREALDAIVIKGVKGLTDSKQSDLIKDFVNKCCLCPNPADRLTTSQLLAHPFIATAASKEQFGKFLLQSSVMYHLEGSGGGAGCVIL